MLLRQTFPFLYTRAEGEGRYDRADTKEEIAKACLKCCKKVYHRIVGGRKWQFEL